MARVLIVEDHENLRDSLASRFRDEGFEVAVASDLAQARAALVTAPDLVVLDWMLPDGQGVDLLREMRDRGDRAPVIFLTARADVVDRVLGLELGASDYVTKPFEPRELIARVRVRLRERAEAPPRTEAAQELIRVGHLTIDRLRYCARFKDRESELVKKEFDLLVLLAESPGKVFSRDEILNKVWGYDVFPTTRTVDTHVLQLRQKIGDEVIQTVRSVGYKLNVL